MKKNECRAVVVAPQNGAVESSYAERARAHSAEALAARLQDDAARVAEFARDMRELELKAVRATNLSVELALSFAEYYLPGEAAAAEVYFNAHYRAALGINFAQFNWILRVGRKQPGPVASLQEIFPQTLQMEFFASGLLAAPERSGPQESHELTPYAALYLRLNQTRVELDKVTAGAERWEAETLEDARQAAREFDQWWAGTKRKLGI